MTLPLRHGGGIGGSRGVAEEVVLPEQRRERDRAETAAGLPKKLAARATAELMGITHGFFSRFLFTTEARSTRRRD